MRTAFIETLCELAAREPRLWLLTGDLGYSVLEVFHRRFPDRWQAIQPRSLETRLDEALPKVTSSKAPSRVSSVIAGGETSRSGQR